MRPTHATVRLNVLAENIKKLSALSPIAEVCCVVKADGYGHGALPVARTAVDAGIKWLAVALVEEGVELRKGGIESPILLLSEPMPQEMLEVLEYGLHPTIYSESGMAAASAAWDLNDNTEPLRIHLKVDTGMHRVGARPDEILKLVKAIENKPGICLEGIWTHLAVADTPENPYSHQQLIEFEEVLEVVSAAGIDPEYRHAANSAGFLNFPESHYNLARVGISIYGILPGGVSEQKVNLEPAMSLTSEVSFVKKVPAGEGISYGHHFRLEEDALIATIPIGYADGIRYDYGMVSGEVLINGRRHPIVGSVTMDQLMVKLNDENVSAGDEVVLIGRQGNDEITATEVADKLGTIPYEVICDIGKRVRREYE